jgi:hypothetical protein
MQTVATILAQATDKQINLMLKLAGERVVEDWGTCGEERIETLGAKIEDLGERLDKRMASAMIDFLLTRPIDKREADWEKSLASEVPASVDEPLTPGVYETHGRVYVVKYNKARTNLYAKVLVEINSDRLVESGDVVKIEFEYAPGAIRLIKSRHRMTVERAEELTIRYGRCINCGRALKAAKSVKAGIGPVCIKSFAV